MSVLQDRVAIVTGASSGTAMLVDGGVSISKKLIVSCRPEK